MPKVTIRYDRVAIFICIAYAELELSELTDFPVVEGVIATFEVTPLFGFERRLTVERVDQLQRLTLAVVALDLAHRIYHEKRVPLLDLD